ncbi:MAG: response regulator [Gammaproteobacteria bacterium]
MRILLIDPSRLTRVFWREKLEGRGYDVVCAESAEEALELLARRRIELVLVAQALPGLDGIGFTRALRLRPQHQATPVILLSGPHDPGIEQMAYAAGVSSVVDKTNVGALWETVRTAIVEHALDLSGRVLYVEDSATAAHVMLDALAGLELTMDHVRSAEEGLAALERENYDLVITDARLEGGMGGAQLVQAIRALPDERALLAVLAVSAADDTEARRALFAAGITDFLGKPALPEEVTARVASLLASRRLALAVRVERERTFRISMNDALSGLLSRHGFRFLAEKSLARAHRYDFPFVLGMVSIEGLKQANTALGYEVGDRVVADVARAIERTSRCEDVVARHGGARFLLLLDHCAPGEDARTRFTRLIEDLSAIVTLPPGLSFVVGYTGGRGHSPGLDKLWQAAESALEQARREGGLIAAAPDAVH